MANSYTTLRDTIVARLSRGIPGGRLLIPPPGCITDYKLTRVCKVLP